MDDNIWEYPFGDLDDEDDIFYDKPEIRRNTAVQLKKPV